MPPGYLSFLTGRYLAFPIGRSSRTGLRHVLLPYCHALPVLPRCLREPPGRPVSLRRSVLLVGAAWLVLLLAVVLAMVLTG